MKFGSVAEQADPPVDPVKVRMKVVRSTPPTYPRTVPVTAGGKGRAGPPRTQTAPPPTCTYVLCVVPYAGAASSVRDAPNVPFPTSVTGTVRVYVGGVLRTTFMRTFTASTGGSACSAAEPNFIGQFTLTP